MLNAQYFKIGKLKVVLNIQVTNSRGNRYMKLSFLSLLFVCWGGVSYFYVAQEKTICTERAKRNRNQNRFHRGKFKDPTTYSTPLLKGGTHTKVATRNVISTFLF